MKDFQSGSHVLPCICGDEATPCTGWMGPPMTYYVHCAACGEWATGETKQEAAAGWNVAARKARRA